MIYRFLFLAALAGSPGFAAEPYQLDQAGIAELAAEAPSALNLPIKTVVDKPQASPSGDAHDYVSFARYYWPDPAKPDGLPFINRDGQHNLEQVARGDHKRLWTFCETVEKLAAAWSVTHDDAAARRAGAWLRAWFITPATRMNPHLEYAQVRLGRNNNRGNKAGVLDARCFAKVIDALLLLRGSPAFESGEEAAIQQWFNDYLTWLLTAQNARDERAATNNHGTWYFAQAIPIARYAGRDDLARTLCEETKALIGKQIRADGAQPEEIRRVDGLGYSVFNLEAHFQVARLATGMGVDLWNYTAPDGGSLRRALDYVRPYNTKPEAWPSSQKAKLRPGFLDELVQQGERVWSKTVAP